MSKREDVRKVIEQANLSGSEQKVLLRVLRATYRKDNDNPELRVEITSSALRKAAQVGVRQLFNVLVALEEKTLLVDVEKGSHVRCRLNVEAINKVPFYEPVPDKVRNADRAQKAREKRAEVRELNRVITACKDAADKDRADLLIKMLLLQDVKKPETKRAMMQWDVDRIRRAKANAENMLAGGRGQ